MVGALALFARAILSGLGGPEVALGHVVERPQRLSLGFGLDDLNFGRWIAAGVDLGLKFPRLRAGPRDRQRGGVAQGLIRRNIATEPNSRLTSIQTPITKAPDFRVPRNPQVETLQVRIPELETMFVSRSERRDAPVCQSCRAHLNPRPKRPDFGEQMGSKLQQLEA